MSDKKPESIDVTKTIETKEAEETREAIAEKPETGVAPQPTTTTTTTTETSK